MKVRVESEASSCAMRESSRALRQPRQMEWKKEERDIHGLGAAWAMAAANYRHILRIHPWPAHRPTAGTARYWAAVSTDSVDRTYSRGTVRRWREMTPDNRRHGLFIQDLKL